MYETVFALTVLGHVLFIGYLVVGGFAALRWRRTIWLHAAAVVWGAASVAGNVGCPLTGLERWARSHAGMPPLESGGFIAHYITGVLYPVEWLNLVRVSVFVLVALSWTAYARSGRHRNAGTAAVSAGDRVLSVD